MMFVIVWPTDRMSVSLLRNLPSLLILWRIAQSRVCLEVCRKKSIGTNSASHLINASTKLRSSRGRAFRESSQRIVRSGPLADENSVARRTAFQSSSSAIPSQASSILCSVFAVAAVRRDQFYPIAPESGVQFVGVAGVITDEILRSFRDHHLQ